MDWDTFCAKVERMRRAQPILFELDGDPPASEQDLEDVERALGVRLPDDYRRFLRRFGGGDFVFAPIFSAAPNTEQNIVTQNAHNPTLGRSLWISENQCGDFYGFACTDGRCSQAVYFYDHDGGWREPTLIAPSFLAFLNNVALRG